MPLVSDAVMSDRHHCCIIYRNTPFLDSGLGSSSMAKVLLVEDDRVLSKLICQHLKAKMFVVDHVTDGERALGYLEEDQFDLVILDWNLPGVDGIDLLKEYREGGGLAPVLFLTGQSDISYKTQGFTSGADDYLCKPFDMQELMLRVDSLLRRPSTRSQDVLITDKLKVEPRSGRVFFEEKEIHLQPKEVALLEFLMRNPNTVFDTTALLNRVWKTDSESTELALRTCISNIRKKLGMAGKNSIIESVYGRGYRLNSKK